MSEIQNPFPNFHAARVKDPGLFARILVLKTLSNGVMIYGGPLKSNPSGSTVTQTYRFPKSKFTADQAKRWLKDNSIKYMSFEKASNVVDFNDIYSDDETTATIFLYGGVGEQNKIDGDEVARKIREYEENGIKTIVERINSGGGSVFNGLSIVAANLNSKCQIHTYNDGICASMAGIIWLTGDETYMADYAQLMLHEPSMGGETIETTTDEKVKNSLIAIRDSLSKIVQNRCGKSKEEANILLNNESWYSSQACINEGFLKKENVLKYAKKPALKATATIDEILEAVTNSYYKQNNTNMNEEIKAILEITDDSQIFAEISNLKETAAKNKVVIDSFEATKAELDNYKAKFDDANAKAIQLEEAIKADKTKITELENKIKTNDEQIINLILEQAINEGKIKASEKDAWKNQFANDIEKLQFAINKTVSRGLKISDEIVNNTVVVGAEKQTWGHKEWSRKDPVGLEEIMRNNTTLYNELCQKSYGNKWVNI